MAIQVYADKDGIGIFDDETGDDWENPLCEFWLDDAKSFLTFIYEVMVKAVDKGWLPVDVGWTPGDFHP